MSNPHHVKTIVYQRYASNSGNLSDLQSRSANLITRSQSSLSRSRSPSSRSHSPLPDHNVLKTNNDEISKYLTLLKDQRDELTMLISKQESEQKDLKTEIARLKYKLKLVTKSLNQRVMTFQRYDQTIREAETLFKRIVVSSDTLLGAVKKDAGVLEETINKKVGTELSRLPPKKLPMPKSRSRINIPQASPSQQARALKQRTAYQATMEENSLKNTSHLNFAFQTLKAEQQQWGNRADKDVPQQKGDEPQKEVANAPKQQGSSQLYPKLSLFGLGHVDSIDYI